jgi:hypothetical protein
MVRNPAEQAVSASSTRMTITSNFRACRRQSISSENKYEYRRDCEQPGHQEHNVKVNALHSGVIAAGFELTYRFRNQVGVEIDQPLG